MVKTWVSVYVEELPVSVYLQSHGECLTDSDNLEETTTETTRKISELDLNLNETLFLVKKTILHLNKSI